MDSSTDNCVAFDACGRGVDSPTQYSANALFDSLLSVEEYKSTAADVDGCCVNEIEFESTAADDGCSLLLLLLVANTESKSLSPYDGRPLNLTLIAAAYSCTVGVISNGTLGGLLGGRKLPPVAITTDFEYCTNLAKPQRMLCTRSLSTFAVRCCGKKTKFH